MNSVQRRNHCRVRLAVAAALLFTTAAAADEPTQKITLNEKADGYRGIWYMNQPSNDEYVYKYSGGLGTYCAKHRPFAIYCKQVDRTFFCYGGTTADSNRKLLHMVSYFDHATGTVPRPTVLLDKQTDDAHDNPVISVDEAGHIWIFSTSHGRSRPSYIHRSKRPYDIDEFQLIDATRLNSAERVAITNFSYMQVWRTRNREFQAFFTRYSYPAARTICFMNSDDGQQWSEWQRIAAIGEGHYQISGAGSSKSGSMFNYHPAGKGLNWRTNLYYVETGDSGRSWHTADGRPLSLPLTDVHNDALVRDYESEGKNVYLKDLRFDSQDRPVLLYITSGGYESGPKNDPRTWTVARWTGREWLVSSVTTSDNNYDFGELWMIADNDWRIIGPTETGPQPYNPGGEIAMWKSTDQGATWQRDRTMTRDSEMNHTYVRRALNAHPDFIAIWADGHGRQPSESRLYISDLAGDVFQLPQKMNADTAAPQRVP
ncbi:MAG: BNR-4 repeat-containing protein [Fuerstiella sp.]